jgi:hypothetical protein
VIAHRGIAAVPRALFTQQAALGMTPQQVWFVSYILGHRWTTRLPHPSLRRMARRTGYSEQHIHNIKDELVAHGYLHLVHRHGVGGGQETNGYDFSALLKAINAHLQHDTRLSAQGKLVAHALPAVVTTAPLRPRRGRRPKGSSEIEVQQDVEGEMQANLVGQVQHRLVPSVQQNLEGSVQAPGEGANPWSGDNATRLRGVGATSLRGEGAAGWRRIETERVEPNKEKDSNRAHPQVTGRDRGDDGEGLPQPAGGDTPPDILPRYSPYIAQVVLDLSRELGDANGPSNVTQALRLWQASGVGEDAFVAELQSAKQILRKAQARGIANKGAYWMAILRDHLGLSRGE